MAMIALQISLLLLGHFALCSIRQKWLMQKLNKAEDIFTFVNTAEYRELCCQVSQNLS